MNRTPAAFVLIVAFTGAAASGCVGWQVKNLFIAEASCPSSRVTVAEVPEVPELPLDEMIEEPPPVIAADPERAAIYYATRRAARPRHRQRTFTAEGCGESRTYTCDIGAKSTHCHW